jgi:hypothetical protein
LKGTGGTPYHAHDIWSWTQSPEAAWVLGLKLKLKTGTLRSWFGAWKRVQSNSKAEIKTNSSTPPAINPDGLVTTIEAAT